MNIILFWLNRCQSGRAYNLLEKYGYKHDWLKHGDVGGLNVTASGRFFEPDNDGDFMIAQVFGVMCRLVKIQ